MRRYPDPDLAPFVTTAASNLPHARTLTAGNHITVADAGALSTVTLDWQPSWRRMSMLYSDMNSVADWTLYNAGTGSSNTFGVSGLNDGNRLGVLQSSTGTTTTGYAGIGSAASTDTVFGTRVNRLTAIVQVPTLSTVAESFYAIIGFHDRRNNLAATDGLYFAHNHALGSNWYFVAYNNSGTTGFVDTGVAVDTGWHAFQILVNSAGTRADFYIDGANVGFETNIGTGTARATGASCHIIKNAGTTARLLNIDLLAQEMDCQR